MKVKTSELSGAALDWAVGKCAGLEVYMSKGGWVVFHADAHPALCNDYDDNEWQCFSPSTYWAQGGLIIGREKISIEYMAGAGDAGADVWVANMTYPDKKFGGVAFSEEQGPTPLGAVMRCYVASKLGDKVEVPDELLQGESE